jgi:peptidoglycan hydrolase-like protein with peptidoglycan-binding domain
MISRALLINSAALLIPFSVIAATPFTSNHPEEAYPDNAPLLASPGANAEFIKRVQQKLHDQGFDSGPINGDFGAKTQTALGQFQLSRALPASGALDDQTLAGLGVTRTAEASVSEERTTQDRALGGSCDSLLGPDKEACLQQGGTVEAGMKSSSAVGSLSRK